MKSGYEDLVGQVYNFPDGDTLTIVQIKWRGDENFLVSYAVQQGPGIPRKLVMSLQEFIGTYGYLFGKGEPPEAQH